MDLNLDLSVKMRVDTKKGDKGKENERKKKFVLVRMIREYICVWKGEVGGLSLVLGVNFMYLHP